MSDKCDTEFCIRPNGHAGKHRIVWGSDGPKPVPEKETLWIPVPKPIGDLGLNYIRDKMFAALGIASKK